MAGGLILSIILRVLFLGNATRESRITLTLLFENVKIVNGLKFQIKMKRYFYFILSILLLV